MAAILSRSVFKRLAQLMVGLLLFAQLVLSAQACMLSRPDQAYTFNDTMATEDGASMDKATCLAHCLKADQVSSLSVDSHFHATLSPASPVAVLSALHRADPSVMPLPFSRRSSGPPLQILFCSFQT